MNFLFLFHDHPEKNNLIVTSVIFIRTEISNREKYSSSTITSAIYRDVIWFRAFSSLKIGRVIKPHTKCAYKTRYIPLVIFLFSINHILNIMNIIKIINFNSIKNTKCIYVYSCIYFIYLLTFKSFTGYFFL